MVINGVHKLIHTIHPLHFIILPLAGCYWASKWQMPVSSPPEKSSPSWKWSWRVQTFKDAIKAFFLPAAMAVTLWLVPRSTLRLPPQSQAHQEPLYTVNQLPPGPVAVWCHVSAVGRDTITKTYPQQWHTVIKLLCMYSYDRIPEWECCYIKLLGLTIFFCNWTVNMILHITVYNST